MNEVDEKDSRDSKLLHLEEGEKQLDGFNKVANCL